MFLEYDGSSKDEDRLFLSCPCQSRSLHFRICTSYDKASLIPFNKRILLAVSRWWLLKWKSTSCLGHCASKQVRLCSSKAVWILGLRRPEWGFFVHFMVLRSFCGWENLDEVNLIVIKGHFRLLDSSFCNMTTDVFVPYQVYWGTKLEWFYVIFSPLWL